MTRQIKVLHLITGIDIGGAEKLLVAVTRELREDGLDVAVGYFKGTGALRKEFEGNGIRTVYLGEQTLFMIGRAVNLYRLLKAERFDLVHTHLIHATLIGRVVSRIAGVPIVITTEHNTSNWQPKYLPVTILYRLTGSLSHKVIAISEAVRKCLLNVARIDPSRVEVVYDGVDIARFNPGLDAAGLKKELGLADAYPVIGSVSRLDARKGLEYLVGAIASLIPEMPGTRLVLVGDGPERTRLQDQAKQLGVERIVTFAGSQEDIVPFLAIMDVFVLPSLFEGLSVSLIEAMAMMKPIVATNVGGIPEVVTDGEDGLLVPPRESGSLAAAIRRLVRDRPLADAMRTAARKKIEQKFSLDQLVRRLEHLYENLLAGTG